MGKLDGKVAVITGGGRGQGRSHAVTLAEEGASIVVCDLAGEELETVPYALGTQEDLDETVRLVEELDQRCVAVKANVADTAQMNGVVETALSEFGQVDILCANAGVFSFSPFHELSDQAFQEVVDTNIVGAFKSIRAVLPHMLERGTGSIIGTSSMAGKQGFPNLGHYAATKWAVIGMIKSVAMETAPLGVRANAVCPTTVDTLMIRNDAFNRLFSPGVENPTFETAEEILMTQNPQAVPYVSPRDISEAVLFLASDVSRYITGETISVGAGWSAMNSA